MDYAFRYSHMLVIVPCGDRTRKAPAFLAKTELFCPDCGRNDYGNASQSNLVMCSRCLMNKAMAQERIELEEGKPLAKKPMRIKIRASAEMKTCHRCGGRFRGRSNRQQFCDSCHRGERADGWNQEEKDCK